LYWWDSLQNSRIELINKLKKEFQSEFPEKLSRYQLDVLSGLTTVADWIVSGRFFEKATKNNWKEKIQESIDQAGFIQPSFKKGLSVQDILVLHLGLHKPN
jgi:CRISPR-associated endonuclease/helicase Cas3